MDSVAAFTNNKLIITYVVLGRPDELKQKISKKMADNKKRNRGVDPTAQHRGVKRKQKGTSTILDEGYDVKSYVPKTKPTAYVTYTLQCHI